MAERKELQTVEERVAFLMDHIPETRNNYVHLILSYWQVFDGIDIPDEMLKSLVKQATQPESVSRARRKVMEKNYIKQFLEIQRMEKAKV